MTSIRQSLTWKNIRCRWKLTNTNLTGLCPSVTWCQDLFRSKGSNLFVLQLSFFLNPTYWLYFFSHVTRNRQKNIWPKGSSIIINTHTHTPHTWTHTHTHTHDQVQNTVTRKFRHHVQNTASSECYSEKIWRSVMTFLEEHFDISCDKRQVHVCRLTFWHHLWWKMPCDIITFTFVGDL